jgi:hypothetical protein
MNPDVQLALVNGLPSIIIAITSLLGTIAAVLGWRKSNHNGTDLGAVKDAIAINDIKTEELGKAVNGRMTAFVEELERRHEAGYKIMEAKNAETLAEAIKAARLETEKNYLAHITDLKTQIAQAKSDADILAAIDHTAQKLLKGE